MRRILLWAGALAFAVWELVGVLLWVRAAGSLGVASGQTWTRLRSDWFLLIVVTDHLVIAGTALLWVWVDMGQQGWSMPKRLACLMALIALGSPALLAYLAERPGARGPGPA